MISLSARYRGALVGLAAGDALGTAVEFMTPGTFTPLTDITGGGPFRLERGQWTDDTSMAMCLAESLLACNEFNAIDSLSRYVEWRDRGYWSSNGRCFDIGITVRRALATFCQTGEPYPGPTEARTAGNGSLMRLAPVPMMFRRDAEAAIAAAASSSRTTHGAVTAVDACRYFAGLMGGALNGEHKETLLSPSYSPVPGLWGRRPLTLRIARVAAGSFRLKSPPGIRGSGYVVESLEAALWAFSTTESFESGALAAANLGNDADTTAAIYGQLAGAYYGVEAIPARWRECIARREEIEQVAERLLACAEG